MSLDTVKMDSPGKEVFMLGNEMIARGAIEAGVSVVACYPGTPSSEISDTLAAVSKDFGFQMEYSANEKVALEVAAGAAIAGANSLAIMKHVGLNVASDAFFSLAYTGVSGALVIIVCDDPFMFSSQTEEDTRIIAECANVPVFDPANAVEAKEMIKEAFLISHRFGTPVMLRPTTRICHTSSVATLGELPEKRPTRLTWDTKKAWWQQYVVVPAVSRPNRLKMINRVKEIKESFEQISFNSSMDGASDTGILTSGVAYNYVLEALENLNLNMPVQKIGTPFPLPSNVIMDFVKPIKTLIVVEEGEPFLELRVRAMVQEAGLSIKICGKQNGFVPLPYEFDVPTVIKAICKVLEMDVPMDYAEIERKTAESAGLAPNRPPTFCAGCPHTATFYALRRATKGKAAFSGDIGCYGLGFLPPFNGLDLMLCMGGSIGMAAGLQYVIDKPTVAIIGDSTFFHSGLSPLASAVYNQSNLTLLILDNSATSMTGLQPHPGTGKLPGGRTGKRVPIEDVVRGMGVEHLKVVDQFMLDETIEAFKSAIEYTGVSVVICRQECVFVKKESLKKSGGEFALFEVNSEQCNGCFLCSKKLGCPAVIQDGNVTRILTDVCVGCGVCAQICPEDAILIKENV